MKIDQTMAKWMEEVTMVLCYQPEIPQKHKEDLCAALQSFNEVNDSGERPVKLKKNRHTK